MVPVAASKMVVGIITIEHPPVSSWLLLRFCYTYDPSAGKYVVAARKVMAIGGGLTVIVTLLGLGLLWRRELKTRRRMTTLAGARS